MSQQLGAGPLRAPFLGSGEGRRPPGVSLLRRAAGQHWPDPTLSLLLLLALAGCTCLADYCMHGGKVSAGPAASGLEAPPFAGPEVLPGGPGVAVVGAVPPPGVWRPDPSSAMLYAAAALVVGLLVCQWACEKVLKCAVGRAVAQIARSAALQRLGLTIEFGRMRTWIFLGRLELRNCLVHNPSGYRSDHLLHVRRLTADFDVQRCFLSLGSAVEIRNLRLDGVRVVIETDAGSQAPDGKSNMHTVLARAEHITEAPEEKPDFIVRNVTVTDITAGLLGAAHAGSPDLQYTDFSKEKGAGSVEKAAVALVKEIGRASLASVGGSAAHRP